MKINNSFRKKILLDTALLVACCGIFIGIFRNSSVLVPIAFGIPFLTRLFFKRTDGKSHPKSGVKVWVINAGFSSVGFLFSVLGMFIAIHGAQEGPENLIIWGAVLFLLGITAFPVTGFIIGDKYVKRGPSKY